MQELTAIFFMTTFVEGFVEFVFSPFQSAKKYLGYVALVVGVATAIAYKIDIPAVVGIVAPIPMVSYIVSGLIIGRGSNYVNDIISRIKIKSDVTPTTGEAGGQ